MILCDSFAYLDADERGELRTLLRRFGALHEQMEQEVQNYQGAAVQERGQSLAMHKAIEEQVPRLHDPKERADMFYRGYMEIAQHEQQLRSYLTKELTTQFGYLNAIDAPRQELAAFVQRIDHKYAKDAMSYQQHFQWRKPENAPFEKAYPVIKDFLDHDFATLALEGGAVEAKLARLSDELHQSEVLIAELMGYTTSPEHEGLLKEMAKVQKTATGLDKSITELLEYHRDEMTYVMSEAKQEYLNDFAALAATAEPRRAQGRAV